MMHASALAANKLLYTLSDLPSVTTDSYPPQDFPEISEVDAFASLDQSFCRRSVEPKVPIVRRVVNWLPALYPWKKCIHHHQLFGVRRKQRRVRVGHHQSYVMSDDSCFLNAQRTRKAVHLNRGTLHADSICWN